MRQGGTHIIDDAAHVARPGADADPGFVNEAGIFLGVGSHGGSLWFGLRYWNNNALVGKKAKHVEDCRCDDGERQQLLERVLATTY
jgi:hypothetical protein